MTNKFDALYNSIMEDLSQQGKPLVPQGPAVQNKSSTTTSAPVQNSGTPAPSNASSGLNVSPQSQTPPNAQQSGPNAQDSITALNDAIKNNKVDDIAAHLDTITQNDPSFFDRPEAQGVTQWAGQGQNLQQLQQSRKKLLDQSKATQATLGQTFDPNAVK